MVWPSYYPENCPPENSKRDSLQVYRLVDYDPPRPRDFVPHKARKPAFNFKDDCIASGLSCYTDYSDARKQKETTPKLKKKKIAKGITHPDYGVVTPTPSKSGPSHHTYWVYEGKSPHTLFSVVDEGEH